MTSDKLSDAVQLIRAGNKQAAVPLLKEILRGNPRDENAWLWLHVCVEDIGQKQYCLQKALEINPDNQPARNALRKLSEPSPRPVQPVSQAADEDKPAAARGQRPWFLALAVGALLLLCLAGIAISVAFRGQISNLSAGLPLVPSPTVTASLTPTSTLTPSPSATIPSTATQSLFQTSTPTQPILTPTPTIAAFTPGNPTATPLGSEITDANFIKGVAAFKAKNYQLVVDLMSAVIATSPDLAPPYRYRGRAYWSLNNCAAALADHEKAISINPDYASAWGDIGLDHECLGDGELALSDFQKALSLDGSEAVVYHNLGVHYYIKGDFEKSLEEYNLSLAIDPGRSNSWANKGQTLGQLKRYDECISAANQALKISSEEWSAYNVRGYCELFQNNYNEAIKDFKVYNANILGDVTSLNNLGAAYSHRGDVYFASGQYNLAIEDYKQAVSIVKGDAHSYGNLSFSYFATNQYQNALDSAKASIAVDPSFGGQKLVVVEARSAYALKDYAAGIEYMNQALAMGTYSVGYYYRGIMYQAAGKNAEAIQDLNHYIKLVGRGSEADDARARLARLKP